MDEKYIGLALAVTSSLAIGTSFIITKKGLIDAAEKSTGYSSENYSYLKNGIWWTGMILSSFTFLIASRKIEIFKFLFFDFVLK